MDMPASAYPIRCVCATVEEPGLQARVWCSKGMGFRPWTGGPLKPASGLSGVVPTGGQSLFSTRSRSCSSLTACDGSNRTSQSESARIREIASILKASASLSLEKSRMPHPSFFEGWDSTVVSFSDFPCRVPMPDTHSFAKNANEWGTRPQAHPTNR